MHILWAFNLVTGIFLNNNIDKWKVSGSLIFANAGGDIADTSPYTSNNIPHIEFDSMFGCQIAVACIYIL